MKSTIQVLSMTMLVTLSASAQQVTPPSLVPPRPIRAIVDANPIDVKRWSAARAWQWYQSQPWPCGFNYIPAHTISYTEMFMPYNFDAAKIDRELAIARRDGFNCARVVLPFVVWEHDPAAFKKRFSEFLAVSAKNGVKVMPTLFDDCAFGHTENPIYGRQPVVVPGWYANGWTPSPGHKIVRDQAQWPRLEKYVKDIIGSYKNDSRVWTWDLYNEPTNFGLGETTVPLVNNVFNWARQIDPIQPLTSDVFGVPSMQRLALDRSDILTFHNYDAPALLQANIDQLQLAGRPIICTEWLNRPQKSTPALSLPIFMRENVGAMSWGFINGRTQTNFPWGAKPGIASPQLWQHDLYRSEFTVESIPAGGYGFGVDYDPTGVQRKPYDPTEISLFGKAIADMAQAPRPSGPAKNWLIPTALIRDPANLWSYTTQQPDKNWETADFSGESWKSGPGGFGTDAPKAWPRTQWDTDDIWLRRVMTLSKIPAQVTLYVHHDENLEVYINGQQIFVAEGYTSDYQAVPLPASALAALKIGANLVAVHCHQTSGGQYVDIGLAAPRQ